MNRASVAIFGAGPAGLMAAEHLSAQGHAVTVYEAMPTVARKFLLAGKSGLNITHGEDTVRFAKRYGTAERRLADALSAFPPEAVRSWADGLGAQTFVGTSGRVFPKAMKASPLLRAWLARLTAHGVVIRTRCRWIGMTQTGHLLETTEGPVEVRPDAALLAFGGASWPRLGSDARWTGPLRDAGIALRDFEPANCGFERTWSQALAERFAGAPIKAVTATSALGAIQGEFVISQSGVEGSLIYAHASALREDCRRNGHAVLTLDLAPGRSAERLTADLARQKDKLSLANRLRKGAGLDAAKSALLRECVPELPRMSAPDLARAIKAMPLPLDRPRPIAEAISSAGGIVWEEITSGFMLARRPGLFVAGEMIDWEAPTGGYLLTACLATGKAAGQGMSKFIASQTPQP